MPLRRSVNARIQRYFLGRARERRMIRISDNLAVLGRVRVRILLSLETTDLF